MDLSKLYSTPYLIGVVGFFRRLVGPPKSDLIKANNAIASTQECGDEPAIQIAPGRLSVCE